MQAWPHESPATKRLLPTRPHGRAATRRPTIVDIEELPPDPTESEPQENRLARECRSRASPGRQFHQVEQRGKVAVRDITMEVYVRLDRWLAEMSVEDRLGCFQAHSLVAAVEQFAQALDCAPLRRRLAYELVGYPDSWRQVGVVGPLIADIEGPLLRVERTHGGHHETDATDPK